MFESIRRIGGVVARARNFPRAGFGPGHAAGYNARQALNPRMTRTSFNATVLWCLVCAAAEAQSRPRSFAGVAAGIATLSADARSEITSSGADVSLYKPENGPALNIFVGSELHE